MGLYQVRPDREVIKLSDETNRSLFSIIDDLRLRLADDLDIAPDGRIFFSEATISFDMHGMAGRRAGGRGNGRIICYDPKTGRRARRLQAACFPNGICMCQRRQVVLVRRDLRLPRQPLLFAGPKAGHTRDRHRQPAGLSRQHQSRLRRQLLARDRRHALARARSRAAHAGLPQAHGAPHARPTIGCIPISTPAACIKFNEKGEILECLWDLTAARTIR